MIKTTSSDVESNRNYQQKHFTLFFREDLFACVDETFARGSVRRKRSKTIAFPLA